MEIEMETFDEKELRNFLLIEGEKKYQLCRYYQYLENNDTIEKCKKCNLCEKNFDINDNNLIFVGYICIDDSRTYYIYHTKCIQNFLQNFNPVKPQL